MTHSSPDLASQFTDGMHPRCCCGRDYCTYLEYNDAALTNLEKDLRRAAEAGQVGEWLQLYSCQQQLLLRPPLCL